MTPQTIGKFSLGEARVFAKAPQYLPMAAVSSVTVQALDIPQKLSHHVVGDRQGAVLASRGSRR